MKKMKNLSEQLAAGRMAFGTFIAFQDPAIIEILGWSGYDFAVLDFEHTRMDWATVNHMIRAAEVSGVAPIARIGNRDFSMALRLVEAGAQGVLAPHVMSADYVNDLADVIRYRPDGDRGIDPSTRSARHGLIDMRERLATPEKVLLFALIEDKEGIDNIEEIVSTGRVDGVMFGPSDLARSYGAGADVSAPVVENAIARASAIVRAAGVKIWRAAFDRAAVSVAVADGVDMVTSPPVDTLFVSRAFRDHLAAIRPVG